MAAMRGAACDEVAKFGAMQSYWWHDAGPLRTLHLFNRVRARYIHEAMQRYVVPDTPLHACATQQAARPAPYRVLDVGCGGGILSESLARLGATVLGIDACAGSIAAAKQRQQSLLADAQQRCGGAVATTTTTTQQQQLPPSASFAASWLHRLDYRHLSVHELLDNAPAATTDNRTATATDTCSNDDGHSRHDCAPSNGFDVVVASEVIEHVDDARGFLQTLCALTRPGGLLLLSTMDKSVRAALSHVLVAEYLTGLVYPGTHDWAKFVPPRDVTTFAARHGVRAVDLQYVVAYPDVYQSIAACNLQIDFALTRRYDTGHYMWAGVKEVQQQQQAAVTATTTTTTTTTTTNETSSSDVVVVTRVGVDADATTIETRS